jgi:antagonist of KipI
MIEILSGGILSTVQDQGRYGYREYGVPISGAMDRYALRVANILVGNEGDAAGIEATFYGLKLRSFIDTRIAITGGDLSPQINDQPVPMWASIRLPKDGVLSFRRLRSGFRAYVAVQGGIDIPTLMNSRSTMAKAAFGGTGGALKSGDRLKIGKNWARTKLERRTLPDRFIPKYSTQNELRVVPGPQADYFSPETVEVFFGSEYTITPQSDRQGYRLTGPALRHIRSYNVITEAVWPGVVQVPGDGFPILLLADAQTTGGYPKIGSVISVDLDKLGQAKPSDKIRFKSVSLERSLELLREQEDQVEEITQLGEE